MYLILTTRDEEERGGIGTARCWQWPPGWQCTVRGREREGKRERKRERKREHDERERGRE